MTDGNRHAPAAGGESAPPFARAATPMGCDRCGKTTREMVFSRGRNLCSACYDFEAQPQLPLFSVVDGGRHG
jgi:hypothetical protein